MVRKVRIITLAALFSGALCMMVWTAMPSQAVSAERSPATWYWMSVSTEKSAFPGMGSGGGMPGMGGMFGGSGSDSGKRLHLEVKAARGLPANDEATHDIPPGQNMGPTLPLVAPEPGRKAPYERGERPEKFDRPKMRIAIYWGCSETVRPGQPYIVDTEKSSPAEFGKAFQGRHGTSQYSLQSRSGGAYADWPNRKDGKQVPANSSLTGSHFVHGNYVPDIRFNIDPDHDFMAPVEFTSTRGTPAESFFFQWNAIPTATGYFATAMGHDSRTDTMIIWSSSDVRDAGASLMTFLSADEVRRLIRDKVVMPPSVTQCVVPAGIFKDAQGAMIQFIAYGDELNIVYPPKPKDPLWGVKVRRKSTSMLPLMETASRRAPSSPGRRSGTVDEEAPPPPPKPEPVTPGKVLKGIFGF